MYSTMSYHYYVGWCRNSLGEGYMHARGGGGGWPGYEARSAVITTVVI